MKQYIDTKLVMKEIQLIRIKRDELKKEQARLRVAEHRLRKLIEAAKAAQVNK